jgi:hypothetical protein
VPIRHVLGLLVAVILAGLIAAPGAPGAFAASSAPPATRFQRAVPQAPPASPADTTNSLHGTWLVGASRPTDPAIATAFTDAPALRGISVRLGWDHLSGGSLDPATITSNIAKVLGPWKAVAANYHTGLMVRFIAGVNTPAAVFDKGAPYTQVNNNGTIKRIPLPWDPATGGPNTVFLGYYDTFAGLLAQWCQQNGVNELHMGWWGQLYSELYFGPEITAAPGYTYQRMLAGHEALYDIALKYRSASLAVEYPLTGQGGSTINQLAIDLASYIGSKVTPYDPSAYVQLNAWGMVNNGLEEPGLLNRYGTRRGLQEGCPGVVKDWSAMYASLESVHADYAEIWASDFSLSSGPSLAQQIQSFAGFQTQLPSASTTAVTVSSTSVPIMGSFAATATVTTPQGIPTGSVNFYLNGKLAKTVAYLPPSGVTTTTLHITSATTYAVTATYSGDPSTLPSTSTAGRSSTVVGTPVPSTTTVKVFKTRAPHGQPYTFYVQVVNGTQLYPRGTVTLHDVTANTDAGSGTLTSGTHLQITTTKLPVGANQSVEAIYAGDTNDAGSTSNSVVVTIT